MPIKLRPSALDRACACPASLYSNEGEILINHAPGEAAGIGSAIHAILARVLTEGLTQLPDVEEFAIAQDVPDKAEEIRILSYVGLKWINENRWRLRNPQCEMTMLASNGDIELRGTADVLDVSDDGHVVIEIWDYKSGQKTDVGTARQQMTAYAYLAAANAERLPEDAEIIVRLLWLRDQEVSTLVFTPAELREWAAALPRKIAWDGKTYTPGDACRWCSRVASCPGRLSLYRSSIEALSDTTAIMPYEDFLPADPGAWGRAIMQAKLLRGWIDEFLKSSVVALDAVGGEVPLPTGQKIVIRSRAGAAVLDPEATIKRLRAMGELTDADLSAMVSLKKGALERFVGAKAIRGEKGKLIESVLAEFEEDGILKRGEPARWVDVVSSEKEA